MKDLAPYDLTKAEKLQIVNLAPTEAVELYVVSLPSSVCAARVLSPSIGWKQIVEEIEDRLGDNMDNILSTVKASLSTPTPNGSIAPTVNVVNGASHAGEESGNWDNDYDETAHMIVDENEFDDAGAGAGVEGDLEAGDDED